jgi:hypothetical protein
VYNVHDSEKKNRKPAKLKKLIAIASNKTLFLVCFGKFQELLIVGGW